MTRRTRHLGRFRPETRELLDRVCEVLEELREYHPLTLRQVYYQLVARLVIPNKLESYKKLSRDLTKARLAGLIPWAAIEDRARNTLLSGGWGDAEHFVSNELQEFLSGYRRDLLQSQDRVLEAWVEKDALSHIVHRAALPYCVPVVVAKGFTSSSYRHEFHQRVEANARDGKLTAILYFGDLDPSGWDMLPTMTDILIEEHGVSPELFEPHRCALNPHQVQQFDLPHSIEALKVTDTRARKYVARFGHLAVELDALPPADLEQIVSDAIEAQLDMAKFETERDAEQGERAGIEQLRADVSRFIDGRTLP